MKWRHKNNDLLPDSFSLFIAIWANCEKVNKNMHKCSCIELIKIVFDGAVDFFQFRPKRFPTIEKQIGKKVFKRSEIGVRQTFKGA